MNSYSDFSSFYEIFSKGINYNKLFCTYNKKIKAAKIPVKLIADIGCGSGSLSLEFAKNGYDLICIDNDENMLSLAKTKAADLGYEDILFLLQDASKIDLYGTVDAVTSSLDVVNHITNKAQLLTFFKRVNLFLNNGGIFVFDINTEKKFKEVFNNNNFVLEEQNVFLVWENFLNISKNICTFCLTAFHTENSKIRRFDIKIKERIYSELELTSMLENSGFKNIKISYTENKNRAVISALKL